MKTTPHIYVAAPFFNDQQLGWVESVKDNIIQAGRKYYSPKDVNLFENGQGFDP